VPFVCFIDALSLGYYCLSGLEDVWKQLWLYSSIKKGVIDSVVVDPL
jgi:hypothetical protein